MDVSINVYIAMLVLAIAFSVIISRVSLVFPAIAIDEDMDFKDSWHYTKNFKLLVYITIIVFPIVFSLLVGGVYTLVIQLLVATISEQLTHLLVLLNVAITVFLVSALSNTYLYIISTLDQNGELNDTDQYN